MAFACTRSARFAGLDRAVAVVSEAPAELLTQLRACLGNAAPDASQRQATFAAVLRFAEGLDAASQQTMRRLADQLQQAGAQPALSIAAATLMRHVMSAPSAADGGEADPAPRVSGTERRKQRRNAAIAKRQAADQQADRAGHRVALERPVESLGGVGPAIGKLLRGRGIETIGDVMWVLPRRYDDESTLTPIASLVAGQRQVTVGVVAGTRSIPRGRGRRMMEVTLETPVGEPGAGSTVRLVWFRAPPGLLARFVHGARFRVVGTPESYRGALSITHPETERIDPGQDVRLRGVVVRYPEIAGIPPNKLASIVRGAVERGAKEVPDAVPEAVRAELHLSTMAQTLRALHMPAPDMNEADRALWNEHRSPHHLRLAFEEFFVLEIALHRRRDQETGVHAQPLTVSDAATQKAASALPFSLTAAQTRVMREVREDLARDRPMRRLLQGDVGSGKTAIAMLTSAHTAMAGAQAALMAPTEILAEQHFRAMEPLAKRLGIRLALVLGGARASHRRKTLEGLLDGTIDLAIGTHALLTEGVQFSRLRLVIVDEQHRFGVGQRLRLVDKGGLHDGQPVAPHLLVMTATPIPRTLTLALHGDLDTSVLDEMPPGRVPPVTRAFSEARREVALGLVEKALRAGGQAYVVCPTIDESETMELRSLVETHRELSTRFAEWGVELLHGRLPAEDKQRAMERFSAGEVKVLIATTMIEVGVDVPAANVILIEHAERFGLAQLHQLRGRVGRGGQRSGCLLVHHGKSEDAAARIQIMCDTTDGFRIAEEDLALRGPGELFGRKQSGLPGFRFGDLRRDAALLERARDAARRVIASDPNLDDEAHATLRKVIERREAGALSVVKEEAG